MKLLFTIENLKHVGGGGYSIFKFAEYLAKRGNQIIIFAKNVPLTYEKKELPSNIKVFYRGEIKRYFKGFGLIDRLYARIYLSLFMNPYIERTKDIDFILGHHTESTIKVNKLAKEMRIPSVSFVFETPVWMAKQLGKRWTDQYKGRFKRVWERTKEELKTVDIILANSNLTKKQNELWLNKKIQGTIYPGLDTDLVNSVSITQRKNQIIYIGRLNKYKNVMDLIKAMQKVNRPPKLVICGDGEEADKLAELARNLKVKCEFKGRISDLEKWKQIKKSLFMVFPTSFEGFGMPPMEALYCETPCICTDIPILREVYKDKVEYFKEHDVNELSKKIEFLINNPDYCIKRGIEGKKYIRKNYSWEKSAEEIEKILLNC